MNEQQLHGSWQETKGKLRERWGELTDQELSEVEGNTEQLVGYIQRKTGEARESIESFLQQIGLTDLWNRATENVASIASATGEAVQQTASQAVDQVKAGYLQTQRLVMQRPVESMAVCLGIGMIAGVVTGLLMRSR